MAAVLAGWGGYYSQRVYLSEARRMGLTVRPPHINHAGSDFAVCRVNGQKLLFMGQEFAQFDEWNYQKSLDWHLLDYDFHRGMQSCVRDLNNIYKKERSLWEKDFTPDGFEGINCDDSDNSIISFIRRSSDPDDFVVVAVNFTPVPRDYYLLGVPLKCDYKEIFNSDSDKYCGSNFGNLGGVSAFDQKTNGRDYTISVRVPPLGAIILKPDVKK